MATYELHDAEGSWRAGTLDRPRGLLGSIPEGFLLCDTNLTVVDVNDEAMGLLGVARDQVVDLPLPLNGWDAVREDGSRLPPEEHVAAIALATGEDCGNVVMGVTETARSWTRRCCAPEGRPRRLHRASRDP